MNGLNTFEKTDREYLIALNDDLIRFWRSKVKGHSRNSRTKLMNTISHELLEQSR